MINFLKGRMEQARKELETRAITKEIYTGKLLEIRSMFVYLSGQLVSSSEVANAKYYADAIKQMLK